MQQQIFPLNKMGNKFMKFLKKLLAIQPKQIEQVYPVEPELIEKDTIVKKLMKKVQSQDAQLSKISAEERMDEEVEKEIEQKKGVVSELQRQKKEIDKKKYDKPVSLRKIFKRLIQDKKFSVEITDKDDIVVFGEFLDLVILPGNYIGIQDKTKKILVYGKTLSQVIFKPESLANQLKRKKIALPCDAEGVYYPDIESFEMPEGIYDETTGKIKWAKFRKKEVKKLIIEREQTIHQLMKELEYSEQLNVDLKRKLNDKERSEQVYKNKIDISETDLSKAMEKCLRYETRFNEMQTQIVTLMEMKNVSDRLYKGLEDINKELITQAEEMGSKTEFRRALDVVQGLLSWAKDKIPRTIIQEAPKQVVEKEPVKPGQTIK